MIVNVPPEEAVELAKNPDVELIYQPVRLLQSYELNNTRKPLNNKKVRQALNHAIDKETSGRQLPSKHCWLMHYCRR